MSVPSLTIGRLARVAGVGIETIRYYQERKLLPTPRAARGGFRTYSLELVDRVRFIKRAQKLGFTLNEVASLLHLEDGTNRVAVRRVAGDRLWQIREKQADLRRMGNVLSRLIRECERTGRGRPCPIISTLAGKRLVPVTRL